MRLEFVDRESYREKTSNRFVRELQRHFGDFYLIPEGGSNCLAMQGCAEIVGEIREPFDIITTPSGTGATLAGIATALRAEQHAIGFAVLKGAAFLDTDVRETLSDCGYRAGQNWHIELAYHFGGYAKTSPDLFEFIRQFQAQYGVVLDAVYTGKMFYGLFDLIGKGAFARGTRIVAVHTGGLQGNTGFADLAL